jgi:NADH:ubiquinone oxidoreductase subunit 3 (subunit A)
MLYSYYLHLHEYTVPRVRKKLRNRMYSLYYFIIIIFVVVDIIIIVVVVVVVVVENNKGV